MLTIPPYEKKVVFWAALEAPHSAKSITQITNDDLTEKNHKLSKFSTSSVAINWQKKYFALF